MIVRKAGRRTPELHMFANIITPQQLDPLDWCFILQNREDAAAEASWVPGLFYRWHEAEQTVWDGLSLYNYNTEWLTEAWPLGLHGCELCKRNITNTKVTIHCNSKATIMSLVMAMLNLGNIVTICWVLGQWKNWWASQTWFNNPLHRS